MTTETPNQQADLEKLVTRVAQRAANNVAGSVADLGSQLALAQETADGLRAALAEKDKLLAEKDAELARAQRSTEELRQRLEAGAQQNDENPDLTDARRPT